MATTGHLPNILNQPAPHLMALVPDGYIPDAYIDMIRYTLRSMERTHRRFVKWLAMCDASLNGGPATDLRKMPSKAAKHQMYSDAARLRRLLKLEGDDSPRNLAGIAALIDQANKILG